MDRVNARKQILIKVKEFQVRNSDVFLLGYPKSGTTWAQEMIWLIMNNLDYEGAKAFIDERVPVLELSGYKSGDPQNPRNAKCHVNSIEHAKALKDPRCIKIHLKWEYLPEEIVNETKKPKIIYIARNPQDVCVSAYHYFTYILNVTDRSLEDFCHAFLTGVDDHVGNYWNHVLYFWKRRDQPNILFLKYEDMKRDLLSVIRKVAKFLEKNLTEEEEIRLVKWLDFESMKQNTAVNHDTLYEKSGFMRVGKIGEHKKEMSAEMIAKFDSWIEENLKNSDYEI